MKKRLTTYVIPMIFLFALFFVKGFDRQAILTEDYDQISSMEISYQNRGNENKTYTMEKDKEVIRKIYGSMVNTNITEHKNPAELERQESDPYFTIEINYKNGHKDVVNSTETGKVIYRIFDDKGSWVGGENNELALLIKK